MTKKEINRILDWGSSHISLTVPGYPVGVTKFQSFLAIQHIIKGRLYWYALRNAYDMSDNLFHYRYDVRQAFLSEEPQRGSMMKKRERDYLDSLPEQIIIYRGMTEEEFNSRDFGVSWTLKKEVAEFFINKYQRNIETRGMKKVICEITINRNEVIAFFNERKEFEIIYIQPNNKL